MTLCPKPRRGMILASGSGWQAIDQVACKTWHCEVCGKTKAYLLSDRIKRAKYNRFITLTHHPKPNTTPEQALRAMRKDWHTLQRALQHAEKGRPLRFVCIVEWTKAGWPHLHILYHGRYIAQKHLSRMWKRIHGAPIVDIRKVTSNDKTAAYLTKYLTKGNKAPYRMRCWSASRGYLPPNEPYVNPNWPEDTKYQYLPLAATSYGNQLHTNGWFLMPGPTDTVIAIDTQPTDAPPLPIVGTEKRG